MYNEQIEALISAALADGVLTEKEKQVLFKKAQSQGIDLDEFEMVLDARLVELKKEEKKKAEKSAPKSTKYGDVRKCPVCGALVPALSGVCPDCGYEFSGIEVSKTAEKLAEKLNNVSTYDENEAIKEKREIIEQFPIPNTKSELIGFLIAAKPHIQDSSDPLAKAYLKKYQQCAEQAKLAFPGDKLIAPYISEYERLKKESHSVGHKWAALVGWAKTHEELGCLICIVLFILLCVIGGIIWYRVDTADERYEEKVIQTAYNGDVEKALKMYTKGVQKYHDHRGWGKEAITIIFKSYLDNDIKKAEYIYSHYSTSGSADPLVYAYVESGNFADAERICKEYDKSCYPIVMGAYRRANKVEDYWRLARNIYSNADSYEKRYNAMENVVKYYCEQGQTAKAKEFIDKNVGWFYTNVDKDPKINEPSGIFLSGHADRQPYKKARVYEQLMTIVRQY